MATTIEHGFSLFTDAEIEIGLEHAAKKDHITLDYGRLRTLANNAGKNRLNAREKLTPRIAAARAIKSYERQYPGTKFREKTFEGYVHAIAKMLSERSPNTRAKRRRETEIEEILAVSYKIDETPPIDPEINRQLSLGLTGSITDEE